MTTPSADLISSSKFFKPSIVSIFANTYMCYPLGPKTSLTYCISCFLEAYGNTTKSNSIIWLPCIYNYCVLLLREGPFHLMDVDKITSHVCHLPSLTAFC